MNAFQFITRVVPATGYIAINWKNKDRDGMASRFFPVAEASAAASFIKWAAGKDSDAYCALASFSIATHEGTDNLGKPKFKGDRKHSNVRELKSFWVDIDVKRVGDKKGSNVYADRREALRWLFSFLDATGLPQPNLWVDSGFGYHVYWVLEDPIPLGTWQPYADALANALKASGFKCETGISSDAARILRPPETVNRKGDVPMPVTVLDKQSRGEYPNQLIYDRLQPYVGVAQAVPMLG
jgi:hypothetical protein